MEEVWEYITLERKRSREGMGDDFLSVDELVVTRFIKKKSLRVKS